jgi:chromosome segregation ATPase
MISRLSQAETDIDNLEKEFNTGRVKVAEGKISGLETRVADLEGADTTINGRIDALVGDNGTIATGDAATLAAAKKYADDQDAALKSELHGYADTAEADAVSTAKSYTDTELNKAVGTLNTKDADLEGAIADNATDIATLQDIVNGYTGKASIQTAVKAAQDQADKGVADAGKAQAAADKAQGEVDALETVVEGVKSTADTAKTDLAALTTRVGTAEGAIDALEAIVVEGDNTNAKLRAAITDLQTLTGADGAIRSEIAAAKKAGDDAADAVDALNKGQVTTNKNNIADHETRIAAIEGDYLQAADEFIFNCGTSTTVVHKAN